MTLPLSDPPAPAAQDDGAPRTTNGTPDLSGIWQAHHRQAGSMNPRVSGSRETVAITLILQTLRPVR